MPTPQHHDQGFYPSIAAGRDRPTNLVGADGAALSTAHAIMLTEADRRAGSASADRAELLTLRRIAAALAEPCDAHGAGVSEDCFPHIEEKVRAICEARYERGAIEVAAKAGRGIANSPARNVPVINESGLDDLAVRAAAVRNAGRDMRIRDAQSARLERKVQR